MEARFVEVSNGFNWGKFVLLRYDAEERETRSALPGYENTPLLFGRQFGAEETFVIDLQTGEGAAFQLDGPLDAHFALSEKHRIWVCPMYEPFLLWLSEQGLGRGRGRLDSIPNYVALPDAEASMFGYRREARDAR